MNKFILDETAKGRRGHLNGEVFSNGREGQEIEFEYTDESDDFQYLYLTDAELMKAWYHMFHQTNNCPLADDKSYPRCLYLWGDIKDDPTKYPQESWHCEREEGICLPAVEWLLKHPPTPINR